MYPILASIINIFNITYTGIKQNRYVYAFLIFALFFILSKLVVFIIEKILLRITKHTKTELDDLILQKIKRPISLILFLFGIKLAVIPLEIHAKIVVLSYKLINSLIILTITYGVIGVVYVLIEHWKNEWAHRTKTKLDDHLIGLLNRTAKYVIGLIGLLFVLQEGGVQIGPLLASLGIAGIAIAFAMQVTLGNIFGGVSLVIDQTIKAGDIIKLETGELGTVTDIGIRSTKILTPDNVILSIPNGKLADSKIQNFSKPDNSLRIMINISVAYGSEPEKVKKILLQELSKVKHVLKEPTPLIFFTEMGDYALKFNVFFWINNVGNKKFDATDEALTRIYNALNKNKIAIPFPTRTVYLKQ